MAKNYATERVLLGPCTVSFPSLFKPSDKTGKYEIDIIYDNGSKTHKALKKLEQQAIEARWGDSPPENLNRLIQDGDNKKNKKTGEIYAGYEGKLCSKARSDRPPQVTDIDNKPIEDPREIKGGDSCVVLLHAFPYLNDKWDSEGIKLTLHGVRKIKDGDALGGSSISAANTVDEMAAYVEPDDDF